MAVGHADRPDPATARRSVPSAWPDSWAGGADSSGPTQLSPVTSIFQFPVETGDSDARWGDRDGRRTCRPAGPSTARRSVPSAWPGSWAGGADSSGPTQLELSTSIFQFPVETGHSDARSGGLANRMCRVRVARSRVRVTVRPMERLYIAHVGVDPPGVPAAGLGCTVA